MSADQPKVVVLDGYTLNPGDLSWERLEALGECTVYDRTSPDEVLDRAQGAELVLTNKCLLPRDVIQSLPKLQYIGVLATGFNIVDVEAAREQGIPVANVPTYGTTSVAQMVFAHLLQLTQHVAEHATAVREGRWSSCADFCFWDFPLLELDQLTMGIVGFGRIGQQTGRLAEAFGMKVLAHDPLMAGTESSVSSAGARMVDLQTLFQESDVVSLHCPLTDENQGFVNRELLELMKPTSLLINTSRGPLIDEAALADALNSGKIAGAGLDVLTVEPPPADHPLYRARNCYITPHIAWATRASRARLLDIAIDNMVAFLAGQPTNVVN